MAKHHTVYKNILKMQVRDRVLHFAFIKLEFSSTNRLLDKNLLLAMYHF